MLPVLQMAQRSLKGDGNNILYGLIWQQANWWGSRERVQSLIDWDPIRSKHFMTSLHMHASISPFLFLWIKHEESGRARKRRLNGASFLLFLSTHVSFSYLMAFHSEIKEWGLKQACWNWMLTKMMAKSHCMRFVSCKCSLYVLFCSLCKKKGDRTFS